MKLIATQKFSQSYLFCLKNKAFRLLIHFAPSTLLYFFSFANLASGQQVLTLERFTIEAAPQYEVVTHPSAALVLRHKTQGFPTFNVVFSPGPWPYFRLDRNQQAEKVLDQYRGIGLTDVTLIEANDALIAGSPALKVTVNYHLHEASMYSEVWLLSLPGEHLIFTAVYKESLNSGARDEIANMLSTVKLANKSEDTKAKLDAHEVRWPLLAIVLALAVIAFLFGARRRTPS